MKLFSRYKARVEYLEQERLANLPREERIVLAELRVNAAKEKIRVIREQIEKVRQSSPGVNLGDYETAELHEMLTLSKTSLLQQLDRAVAEFHQALSVWGGLKGSA